MCTDALRMDTVELLLAALGRASPFGGRGWIAASLAGSLPVLCVNGENVGSRPLLVHEDPFPYRPTRFIPYIWITLAHGLSLRGAISISFP